MKIGIPADKPTPAVVTNGAPAANSNAQAAGAPAIPETADASTKIELSNTASTLLSSATTAEFDAGKVARISDAIDSGTFKINPTAIADKLIANAQELLSKVRP
ncbi:MAG TPA: flagellar biosynthesis anti-sigma factor FlgM [Burkholderiaceae bacterium]